ncbi:MAG: tetratricopeptide repeat protein [Pseudomonadota bacterium]
MRILTCIALTLALVQSAQAAYDPTDPRPDLDVIKAQIESGGAGLAIIPLYDWLITDPDDADALNLLGYAYRKLEQWEKSRAYYEQALKIAPAHLGALEYMGELELQTGNPTAARTLLIRLRSACPEGCHELDDLIEAFKDHGISTGGS